MAARTFVRSDPRGQSPVGSLARLLVAESRWKLALVGLLTLGVGAASALAVLLLVPVLQAAGVAVSAGGRPTSRLFAAATSLVGSRPSLPSSLAALIAVTAAQAVLNLWHARTILSVTHDVIASVRRRLFDAICHVEWARFGEYRSSDLLEALTSRVERVGWATRNLVSLGTAAVTAAVYVVVALNVSVAMTLVSLAAGTVLSTALHRQRRRSTAAGETLAAVSRELFASIGESLTNMKTIRAHGAAGRHAAGLAALSERERAVGTRLTSLYGMTKVWLEVGAVSLLAIVTWVAVRELGVPAGELLVLLFVFTRLTPQLSSLQQAYQSLIVDLPAFVRVEELIDQCASASEPRATAPAAISFEHAITLDRVSYGYGDECAVSDVSLSIPAGSTVAIVGPSGAGKTTVADLVLGLLTPRAGVILIDGVPLTADRGAAWRDQIGYVSQDGFLFHESVRANLLWAAPAATDDELWTALRSAAAADFVANLPQGLETMVGDRGVLLSGGERQRLAFARALLRRPRLLVLDEPASALDAVTACVLEDATRALHGQVTILLITHRLATVRRADAIYVLDRGRVVEYGTWDALLAARGSRFQALYRAQEMDVEAANVQ